ncbi:MAG: uracil-DNA glycosylase [Desulfobacterales bacterium]|nr:uracil-DNA glycosylase [Desulfobacterales bacterium]MCP4161287.1 uracil-DNA glycosylase [Deltaproteobacteria bacterium]
MRKRILCQRCKYYFVTWNKSTPHGCRGMGFKSALIPSLVVFKNSGESCQMYTEKEKKKDDR